MRRSAPILIGLGSLLGCRQILDLDDFTNVDDTSSPASTGVGGGGGGGAGGTSPVACGQFGALFDDFEDDILDKTATRPGWTTSVQQGTVFEGLGQVFVQLEPATDDSYGGVVASHAADLRGDSVTVRVPVTPTEGDSYSRVLLAYDGNNHLGFEARSDGVLIARKFIDGTASEACSAMYDPVAH